MPTEAEINDLLARLARTPTRIARVMAGLQEVQIRQAPAAGEWAMVDIVEHVRAADDIIAGRVLPILVRDQPSLAVYDERRWAEVAGYTLEHVEQPLETFGLRRAELVQVLRRASLADWERVGIHEVRGPLTLAEMVRGLVEHEEEHCAQLEALRAGLGELPAQVGPEATVTLREVTRETVQAILNLKVAPQQRSFVASNAVSLAQAHFYDFAWFRAIYADEVPVGFVMLADQPEKSEYFLWRLMIAADQQGKGYGRRAVQLLIEYVKTRPNASELLVSYEPGEGGPGDFYYKLGFQDTGRVEEGEIVLRLPL
jgi:diamine N-acetyltransferase